MYVSILHLKKFKCTLKDTDCNIFIKNLNILYLELLLKRRMFFFRNASLLDPQRLFYVPFFIFVLCNYSHPVDFSRQKGMKRKHKRFRTGQHIQLLVT